MSMISDLAEDEEGYDVSRRPLALALAPTNSAPDGTTGNDPRGAGRGALPAGGRGSALLAALVRSVEGSRLGRDISPLPPGKTLESLITGVQERGGSVVARLERGHVCPFAGRPHGSNGAVLAAEIGGFSVRYTCLSGKCREARGGTASADVVAPPLDLTTPTPIP
jgi:hypothetical protein